jgi:hypothetical protein
MVRRQVDPRWSDLAARGLIAICDPVLVETLTIADAKAYDRIERGLRDLYPWVPVPDDAWQVVRAVRRNWPARAHTRGCPWRTTW